MKIMTWLKDPKRRHGRLSLLMLALFLALAILCVLVVDALELRHGWRADYSFNGVTTQSETTKAILNQLDTPVHLYALFQKGNEDLQLFELLNRYAAQSDQVTWEQVDITLNPGLVVKFQGEADNPLTNNCLVVSCEKTGRYRILSNFVSLSYDIEAGGYTLSDLNYEREISEAIVYVTREHIPPVMMLEGHNELDQGGTAFLTDYLGSNHFDVRQVNLQTGDTLDPSGVLMLLSPQKDLHQDELEAILAFAQQGGSLFITCSPLDPVNAMPNYLSLLRAYGFIPREGMVVAGTGESGTYYNESPIALIPYMQSTAATQNLVAAGEDILLLPLCRAFEEPGQTDNALTVETVLYSGYQAYLHPVDADTLTQTEADALGPFPLALLSSRMMEGEMSRAFIAGNATFLTQSDLYAMTDTGVFLLSLMDYLLGGDAISLDIAAKPAVRPGLSAAGQELGIVLIVMLPMVVLLAAVWVLLPRRHR